MKQYTLEEFLELVKPKSALRREDLESLSDEKLNEMMTQKFGFPRFGTWADFVRERDKKIDFIITGKYPDIYKGLSKNTLI